MGSLPLSSEVVEEVRCVDVMGEEGGECDMGG